MSLETLFFILYCLFAKGTLKAFDDFRNNSVLDFRTKVYEVMLFDMQKYVYTESVFNSLYTINDKINGTKHALFFLSRASTHHSFTFDLGFLYELKHKVRLSKIMCEIFHFQFHFVFIKVYIFVQRQTPFKIKIIEKPHKI